MTWVLPLQEVRLISHTAIQAKQSLVKDKELTSTRPEPQLSVIPFNLINVKHTGIWRKSSCGTSEHQRSQASQRNPKGQLHQEKNLDLIKPTLHSLAVLSSRVTSSLCHHSLQISQCNYYHRAKRSNPLTCIHVLNGLSWRFPPIRLLRSIYWLLFT
jgi:hypothetical protein